MLAPIRFLCAGIAKRFSTSVGLVASAAVTSPINTWYVLRRCGSRPNPTPLEAFDWGSQSTRSVVAPSDASEAARLMAVVVLPTPPFWLAMAITRATDGRHLALETRTWRRGGQRPPIGQTQIFIGKTVQFLRDRTEPTDLAEGKGYHVLCFSGRELFHVEQSPGGWDVRHLWHARL